MSLHDAVGGAPFFQAVVERFYEGVQADPLLRPLYPDDLTDSVRHMVLFLQQYWGGPGTYSEERGHPRLRMRHAPFVIGEPERDAWLRHMVEAVDATVAESGIDAAQRDELVQYFVGAADFLVNAR